MKKEIPPGMIIAVLAVIVLVIGFFAFRTFFSNPNYTPLDDPEKMKEYQAAKQKSAQNWQQATRGGGSGGAYRNQGGAQNAAPGGN